MIPANILEWVQIIAAVIGVFSLIATITPNETDNKVAQWLVDLVNLLGANVGNASNKKKRKK
jgi:hypothetical protein